MSFIVFMFLSNCSFVSACGCLCMHVCLRIVVDLNTPFLPFYFWVNLNFDRSSRMGFRASS